MKNEKNLALDNTMHKTAKYRALDAMRSGFLPPSMTFDDCYQEALLFMLEHPDKPKAYMEFTIPLHLRTVAHKNRVGPSAAVIGYHKKKGAPLDFGEYSLEVLASNNGGNWEDFLDLRKDDEVMEVSFFTLTLEEATDCLTDLRAQQKKSNDSGISYAKTRNKWHLECTVQKRKQFIGQYLNIEDARAAKQKFLGDLMDAILDAISNE